MSKLICKYSFKIIIKYTTNLKKLYEKKRIKYDVTLEKIKKEINNEVTSSFSNKQA